MATVSEVSIQENTEQGRSETEPQLVGVVATGEQAFNDGCDEENNDEDESNFGPGEQVQIVPVDPDAEFVPVPADGIITVNIGLNVDQTEIDADTGNDYEPRYEATELDLEEPTGEPQKQLRKKRGKYTKYSVEDRLVIGRIAAEVGNCTALRKFKTVYPSLSESTVRSFKLAYLRELSKDLANSPKGKRGKYMKYSDADRAEIGRYALNFGSSKTMRAFKEKFPGLSESTVRGFKNCYLEELEKRNLAASNAINNTENSQPHEGSVDLTLDTGTSVDTSSYSRPEKSTLSTPDRNSSFCTPRQRLSSTPDDIKALPRKRRGRPSKLPTNFEDIVKNYLEAIFLRYPKAQTYKTAIAIGKGVVLAEDKSLLEEFGGDIKIDKSWAKALFHRMCLHSVNSDNVQDHPVSDSEIQHNITETENHFVPSMTAANGCENVPEKDQENICDQSVENDIILQNEPFDSNKSVVIQVMSEDGTSQIIENATGAVGPTLADLPELARLVGQSGHISNNSITIVMTHDQPVVKVEPSYA